MRFEQRKIWLGGVIVTKTEADELIATITALKSMLRDADVAPTPAAASPSNGDAVASAGDQ